MLRIPFQDERHRFGDIVSMLNAGIGRLGTEFEAMVIANQAPNFSVGANLMLLLMSAAGGRVGRYSFGRPPISASEHGHQVCASSRGGGSAGNGAGRRLRNQFASAPDPSGRGNVYGSCGNRSGTDSGGRWNEGNADTRQ